jgi:hypothetical protein
MRTRIIILTLAATAATLTSCGLSSPTGFDGQPGSLASKAKAEATYMEKVHNALPAEVLDTVSNDDLMRIGEATCDRLDEGETPSDIFDDLSDEVAATDDVDELEALVQLATIVDVAIDHLCPELS